MSIFKSTSRFKLTPLVRYNNILTPGLMKRFDFLDNIDDDKILNIEIDGSRAGRPDLISNDIYGTTLYKWILILFNNVTDPFDEWPKVGTTIKAPTNDVVWGEL